ncbi:N-acetylglucosamine-1-phosphotransferase subunit gamma-like isoform X2 [Ornithodoros turicata]
MVGLRIVLLLAVVTYLEGVNVPIRFIPETSSGLFGNNNYAPSQERLVLRTNPENFSGPSQLQRLVGKCFNYTTTDYRYSLCPFQNITQVEESFRWNAYKGVLGVWQGWKIVNNTFAAMVYSKGDLCGKKERLVEVTLACGQDTWLTNVTEPEQCIYRAILVTRLVCHRDALLVYPRMLREHRQRWDIIETNLSKGALTEKGYNEQLENLFVEAGFAKAAEKESTTTHATSQFTDIAACNAGFFQLEQELEHLRERIASHQSNTSLL